VKAVTCEVSSVEPDDAEAQIGGHHREAGKSHEQEE
jgi:hypothetical protein